MRKLTNSKINAFIDKCIGEFLFEQGEKEMFDKITDFLEKEEKRTKLAIDTDTKIKNAQSDPAERALKDKQIRTNQERLANLKVIRDELAKQVEAKKKAEDALSEVRRKASVETRSRAGAMAGTGTMAELLSKHLPKQATQPATVMKPKRKKAYLVRFDTKTEHPWEAKFTERGFVINGTRLSFELIETALSKNFNVVLDGGSGMNLDQVKMQKIMRYKNMFKNAY